MKTRQQIIQEQLLKILSEAEKVKVIGVETTTEIPPPLSQKPRTDDEWRAQQRRLDQIEPLRRWNGLDRWGKPLRDPYRSAAVR